MAAIEGIDGSSKYQKVLFWSKVTLQINSLTFKMTIDGLPWDTQKPSTVIKIKDKNWDMKCNENFD